VYRKKPLGSHKKST
jgi:hypothetical protein